MDSLTQTRRTTVLARDLLPGDRITCGGSVLVVAAVDSFGACAIVEFTDGTATAPVLALAQVAIDRPVTSEVLA